MKLTLALALLLGVIAAQEEEAAPVAEAAGPDVSGSTESTEKGKIPDQDKEGGSAYSCKTKGSNECSEDLKFDAMVAEWSEGKFAEFENTKPRQDDLFCGEAFTWTYEEDPEDIIKGNTSNICMGLL